MDYKTCWALWAKIHIHPVKVARTIFPRLNGGYVATTKLIGAYAANKGTALGLLAEPERRDVYLKIAAKIYTEIPEWARSINLDFLEIPPQYKATTKIRLKFPFHPATEIKTK
jgi:hypothetical protein